MIIKVFIVVSTIGAVLGYTKVFSNSSVGYFETCYSSQTISQWIVRQWMTDLNRLPRDDKYCDLHTHKSNSYMTDDVIISVIETLQTLDQDAHIICSNEDKTFTIGVQVFYPPDGNLAGTIDCNSKLLLRELNNEIPPVKENSKEDSIKEMEKEIKALKESLDEKIKSNENLRRSLDSEILKNRDKANEADITIDELNAAREAILQKEKELHNLLKEIDQEKKLSDSYRQELLSLRRAAEKPVAVHPTRSPIRAPVITTAMTILAAVLSAEAPPAIPGQPHYLNRQGQQKYIIPGDTDSTCGKIDYEVNCLGFTTLFINKNYKFFQSHYHSFAPLEAQAASIIEKSTTGFCGKDDSATKKTCSLEFYRMSWTCPSGFKSAHFIDQEGKLAGFECKAQHHVSSDCKTCVKVQDGGSSTSSILLQDAVCQADSSNLPTIKPLYKDYCFIGKQKIRSCRDMHTAVERRPFVLFKTGGKIYLDSLVIRTVEVKGPSNFVCYKAKGQQSTQDASADKTINPSECRIINTSKSEKCTGDVTFCSMYNCDNDFADVHCSVAVGGGTIEVNYGGLWVKPRCVGYDMVAVGRPVKAAKSLAVRNCDTCNFECQEDGILIRSTGFKITSAVACSHGVCISKTQEPSTSIKFKYPGALGSVGGKAGINLSHDDEDVSDHLEIECPPRDPCSIHDCIVCSHGLINYQCHTALSAFVVVLAFTSIGLVGGFMLYKILRILKIIPKHFIAPAKWTGLLLAWMAKKIANYSRVRAQAVNREIGWHENNRRPARVTPIPRYSLYMAVALSLVSMAGSCGDTVIASSKVSKCRIEGSQELCRLSGIVTAQAGPIGSETCLLIKGPSEHNKRFLSIRTVSSELICIEGQTYWTGQYSPACLSSRRCRLTGECHGDSCLGWNETEVSREFGHTDDESYMTENRCFEQCGGVGCGCFSVYPSCLFVHTKIKPISKQAFKVFSCVDWAHRITFEITDFKGQKDLVTLNNMNTRITPWGSMSLSIDAESITGTNSYSFMKSSSGSFAIVDEAFSDNPRKGFLGEIRCSSEAAASSAHVSCLRAPHLISYKPLTDQVECTSQLIDPVTVFMRGALPQTRAGKTFASSKDRATVQAMASSKIQASISLVFDDYDVEFLQTSPTCSASFLNISGCYSCSPGAQVCVKVKASTAAVFEAHNDDLSKTLLFNAKAGTFDYCKTMYFSTPRVDLEMMYTCSGDPKLLEVKGELILIPPHDDRSDEGGESTVVNPKDGDWSIDGWFKGLIDWLGGPLKSALKIIGYIILAVLAIIMIFTIFRIIFFQIMVRLTRKIK
ncbi:glycoprotein precursor [Perkerra virus]|uniref:Envelopment polyprotein n=1 Tax=Perkerra virus TaxID=2767010 RepID=A0A7G8PYK7_9VIRU|nr:glycoprotein precursor [Perkerra virus]QNJ99613.1 glycoprotein precursor [Perkerra virus]